MPHRFSPMLSWLGRLQPTAGRRRRGSRSRSAGPRLRPRLELLESRRVLAITDLASLVGTVFNDQDGDGLQGAAEPAVAGATVELYRDVDGSGTLDTNVDALLQTSAPTGVDGRYELTGLEAGDYLLRQVPGGGLNPSAADAVRAVMLSDHELLNAITHHVVIPDKLAQELLQRSRSDACSDGDWLDALLRQVRELPANVDGQMFPRIAASKALGEVFEEAIEFRFQEPDLLSVHARSSITSAGGNSLVNLANPSKAKIAL